MKFRIVNDERMPKVKNLWSRYFEKAGTPFFEYYFNEYCGKDNTVVGGFDEQDNLLTMLHLNPYMLKVRGVDILIPYIVGVATDEQHRGRHLFGELLQVVFQMLRSQNFPFVFLLPVAEKIYSPYEFAFVDYRPKYNLIDIMGDKNIMLQQVEPEQKVLQPLYEQFTKDCNCVVRTDFQWRKLLAVVRAEGMVCKLVKQNDAVIGYVLVEDGDRVTEYVNVKEVGNKDKLPFMMARCIDARAALDKLSAVQCADGDFNILLTDDFVEDNNHLLHITVNDEKLQYESTVEQEDFTMDIASFTQLYFGTYDVLELVEQGGIQVNNPIKLAMLSRLFPKCRTFINEYF